mgnify:CR=1 FL=1
MGDLRRHVFGVYIRNKNCLARAMHNPGSTWRLLVAPPHYLLKITSCGARQHRQHLGNSTVAAIDPLKLALNGKIIVCIIRQHRQHRQHLVLKSQKKYLGSASVHCGGKILRCCCCCRCCRAMHKVIHLFRSTLFILFLLCKTCSLNVRIGGAVVHLHDV